MNTHIILAFATVFCIVAGQVDDEELNDRAERLAKMMQHDGIERVVKLTNKNYKSYLKKFDIVIVLFHAQTNLTMLQQEKNVLEVIAKLFDKKGLLCATSNLLKHTELARDAGVLYAETMIIFNHGRPSTFLGQRSPDILVPYISKLFAPAVTEILSKTAKKIFDNLQSAKVIAYLQKSSPEYIEYTNTARWFQPMVQFHVVFDAKIAKSLQLKKQNSLLFIKPFEKAIKLPTKISWKEASLKEFIQNNKRQIIRKMSLENIHEIWSPDTKGFLVVVFAKIQTQDGNKFFSLVKSLAKRFASEQTLNFVWIDPDPFPAMKQYWQSTFNIDPTKPSIGAVDLTGQASSWLSRPENRELTLNDLKKWTNDLLSGKLKMEPMKLKSAASEDPGKPVDEPVEKDEL